MRLNLSAMKKYILLFTFLSFVLGQFNQSDLRNLSNEELDLLRNQLSLPSNSIDLNENSLSPNIQPESIENVDISYTPITNIDINENFGYDYFNSDINFYDNIPTPADFKLGPGDEIIVSLWGETNLRQILTINKSGLVYFENIGFVNISNKTISEAENLLIDELSKIYSTLKVNGETNLMLELSRIKSINVFFTGEVENPGVSLIHPFSDAFSALIQAGGIKDSGTLRNIQLIRNGEIIENIDFYSFFTSGVGNFQKIKIIDGDVIHVPIINTRVEIDGQVERPKFYELLDSESLFDLIDYAGGLTHLSSSKAILYDIFPLNDRKSDDSARYGKLIDLSLASEIFLNDGSSVTLIPINNNDINVSIFGRVVRPGDYPIQESSTTLKDILDIAGGFNDPIFRKTIDEEVIILRLDNNQFYGEELKVKYENSSNFLLEINDKIFIYTNSNYYNDFSYTISGEIQRPGTYPLKQGLTLSDAINVAGGLTEMGSIKNVVVTKNLIRVNQDGNQINEAELVADIDLDFLISNENNITILPKTNVIRVEGNVYNPGLISHQSDKNMTVANAIELAGGYKPYSLKKRVYVVRSNGEIERNNIFRGTAKRVFPGDSVIVPVDPNPSDFNITSFISDLSTTLANIAAILILVDNNNN